MGGLMRAMSVVLLALAIAVAGCGGVKTKTLTAENKDRVFDEIKHSSTKYPRQVPSGYRWGRAQP
jgi:hypothetical protein